MIIVNKLLNQFMLTFFCILYFFEHDNLLLCFSVIIESYSLKSKRNDRTHRFKLSLQVSQLMQSSDNSSLMAISFLEQIYHLIFADYIFTFYFKDNLLWLLFRILMSLLHKIYFFYLFDYCR